MNTAIADKPQLGAAPSATGPAPRPMMRVAREHGVGPLTQYAQILALWLSSNGVERRDYYQLELYRKDFSARDRGRFLGAQGGCELNLMLTPEGVWAHDSLINDQLALADHLAVRGIATVTTQAVYGNRRPSAACTSLKNVAQLLAFLTGPARYPLFVKPAAGSRGTGAARIERLEPGARTLRLSSGRGADLIAFAEDLVRDHGASGLLLQTAVTQHDRLTDMAGPTLGTIRVVTVTEEEAAPRPLYAVWRLPAPGAVTDDFWQAGAMLGHLDLRSGAVTRLRRGTGLESEVLTRHPATGAQITGEALPHWSALLDLAVLGHREFPDAGILGWDIGLTQAGPVILGCNGAPNHALYQLAGGEGLLNDRFAPVLRKIAARQAARLRAMKKTRA